MCVKNVVKRVLACVLLCLPVCVYAEWPEYPGTEGVTGSYCVLEVSGEQSVTAFDGIKEYDLNGPAGTLAFSAKKAINLPDAGKLHIFQYIDGQWNEIWSNKLTKSYTYFSSILIDSRATRLQFKATGGGYDRLFKNVKVSMATVRPTFPQDKVDFGLVYFNAEDTVQTFVMDWCNTNALAYSLEGDAGNQFEVWIENNAEMGKYGTAKVNVRYKHSALGEHSATLTIDGKAVTLHGVTKGEQRILWSQNLMGYIAAEDGTIDESTPLTAYASCSSSRSWRGA